MFFFIFILWWPCNRLKTVMQHLLLPGTPAKPQIFLWMRTDFVSCTAGRSLSNEEFPVRHGILA
jgi:hypothetical protein